MSTCVDPKELMGGGTHSRGVKEPLWTDGQLQVNPLVKRWSNLSQKLATG